MVTVLLLLVWVCGFILCAVGLPLKKNAITGKTYWFSNDFDEGFSQIFEKIIGVGFVFGFGGALYVALTISIFGIGLILIAVIVSIRNILTHGAEDSTIELLTPKELQDRQGQVLESQRSLKEFKANFDREQKERIDRGINKGHW